MHPSVFHLVPVRVLGVRVMCRPRATLQKVGHVHGQVAAELFATWAVAEAAASAKPFTAVIAVGDCDPAADALDAASSATPQMSALLARARGSAKQWLGVSVPREWNLDADRLSHPAELGHVLRDARRAGLSPCHVAIPEWCWRALRDTTTLAAAL